MLTQNDIDKFYADLAKLKLRFPNAALEKATGFSKGNVSEYLNKRKTPSAAFIKKFYEAFPPESSKEVHIATAEEPQVAYTNDKLTGQTIFNLSESGRQHAAADKARAEAELLREQNTRRMIELITTENAPAENQITFDAIAGGLRELLVDLGLGKHWKSREEGTAIVRNKLFGGLKKNEVSGTRKR